MVFLSGHSRSSPLCSHPAISQTDTISSFIVRPQGCPGRSAISPSGALLVEGGPQVGRRWLAFHRQSSWLGTALNVIQPDSGEPGQMPVPPQRLQVTGPTMTYPSEGALALTIKHGHEGPWDGAEQKQ